MAYALPKPVNKHQLKRDVQKYEQTRFKQSGGTLSQALDDPHLIQVWDVAELSSADIAVIYEHFAKPSQRASLMLVHLKV